MQWPGSGRHATSSAATPPPASLNAHGTRRLGRLTSASRPHSLPPLPTHSSPSTDSTSPVSSPPTMTGSIETEETSTRKLIGFSEILERRRLAATAARERPTEATRGDANKAGLDACARDEFVEAALDGSGPDLAAQRLIVEHAQELYAAGHLSQAYLYVSSVLPEYEDSPFMWARLRSERARCSYALINFRECVDDCKAALRVLVSVPCGDEHIPSLRSETREVERTLWTHLTRACVMREDYARAETHYDQLLSRATVLGLDETDVTGIESEKAALPIVQALRVAIVDAEWEVALRHLRSPAPSSFSSSCSASAPSCGLATLVSTTPLRALEAVVLLELDFVDEARAILLAYLPSLLSSDFIDGAATDSRETGGRPPPTGGRSSPHPPHTLMNCTAEEKLLYRNLVSHYLQCTVMAAKASVYTSVAYMNIAAVLVKRCLLLEPTFAPAMSLGSYLVRLEDHLAAINAQLAKGDWLGVLEETAEALKLDARNKRVAAVLHVYRAEAFAETDKPLNGIEACTLSLRCNPCNARAFFLRGLLHRLVRQPARATADEQRAVELAPSQYTVDRFDSEWEAMLARQHARVAAKVPSARGRSSPFSTPLPSRPSGARAFPRRAFNTASGPGSHRAARTTTEQSAPLASSSSRASPRTHNGTDGASGAVDAQTLYDLLQVLPSASTEEVRRSYKILTLRYHPDKVVNESEEVQMHSLHMFKRINEAHNVLTDPVKRAAYDQSLRRSC